MRIFTFILFLLFPTLFYAQQLSYSRARVYLDQQPLSSLLQTGVNVDHGTHRAGYIENDFSNQELQLMTQAGFRYEVLIPDVVEYYQRSNRTATEQAKSAPPSCGIGGSSSTNPVYATPSNFSLGSMGGYFTYPEMLAQLDSMAAKYPNLISARQAINPNDLTHEGRPIYWVKISDNPNLNEAEPQTLYNALHHAREALSLSQLIYYMWYLLENYDNDPNIQHLIDNTELYFIPCINPDGYIYNQTTNPNGGGMWRKNRRNNGGGTYGVDLNRNYGYQWAYDNVGSSGSPSSDTYRGPSAFSEAETRNVRDFALSHNFVMAINYHTYGGLLVYPWAYNGYETADSLYYRPFGNLMTQFNGYLTGTGTTTVGYNSNGDADDWLYGEQTQKNKILSMTPEASSGFGFWPPSTEIINLCNETLWQNLSYAYLLLNFGQAKDQSAPLLTQTISPISYQLTRYGFSAGSLTVGINPISSNISTVGNPKNYTLGQLQATTDSIALILNSGIPNGASVVFELYVDNGAGLVFRDTITKTFGSYQVLLNDTGNNMNNWTNIGTTSNWQSTTSSFYSPSSSITDSKTGNYANNTQSEILLNRVIDLRGISDASLNFWAKWDIEDNYDYVQVAAAGNNGVFQPLCGLYTQTGSAYQDPGQPVFDGQQGTWVQEDMSLNSFLGDSAVFIRIRLKSDQWLNYDGFYFDDLRVNLLSGTLSSTEPIRRNYPLLGQSQPNPAKSQVYIPFDLEGISNDNLQLQVVDLLGRVMASENIANNSTGVHLTVSDWSAGTYFYQIVGDGIQSAPKKLVIDAN